MNKLPIAAKNYFKEVKKHLSWSWGKKKIYIDYIKDQLIKTFYIKLLIVDNLKNSFLNMQLMKK